MLIHLGIIMLELIIKPPSPFGVEVLRIPRLEMFARQSSPGWDVFGNQVENTIQLNI